MINSWKPLTVFAKRSILDVWQGFEYVSGEKIETPTQLQLVLSDLSKPLAF